MLETISNKLSFKIASLDQLREMIAQQGQSRERISLL
jgi:hypothetical protein